MIVLASQPDDNWRAAIKGDVTGTVGSGASLQEAIGNLMLIVAGADDAIHASETVDFSVQFVR
jgi:hypothetical protein